MLYSDQDLFFSSSLAVYVAVGLIVAIVRWGHKCEPFAQHMDYYYPAWKVVVCCFLSVALLIPAVFKPQDSDAILQLRIMLMLSSPFYAAAMMFAYFGKVLKKTWWRRPVYILALPISFLFLAAFVHTVIPGTQMEGFPRRLFVGLTAGLSVLYLIIFFMALYMVASAMRRFSEQNYSNPDDFPRSYASKVIWIPILHVGVSWASAFIGTQTALCWGVLLQSVLNVMFLIGALSPHRARDVEQLDSGEQPATSVVEALPEEAREEEDLPLSQARGRAILKTLKHLMEEDQVFLDSHLTLASLSRSCGVNRTYVSRVMNESLGGFFNYVNRCRLDYANELKARHPEMSVDELVMASGFGSRQSYYNIRRSLKS